MIAVMLPALATHATGFNAGDKASSWLLAAHGSHAKLEQVALHQQTTGAGDKLRIVKIFWRDGSGSHRQTRQVYDGTGALLADGGLKLRQQAATQRWAERGALSSRLHGRVQSLLNQPITTPITVDLLVQVPFDLPNKLDKTAVMASESAYQSAVRAARKKLLQRLSTYGIAAQIVQRSGTLLRFETSAQVLNKMRHDTQLGPMGIGAKRPAPQGVSTVWGTSVWGWNTGYDGTGIDVCLIDEYLPTTQYLNDLSFASVRFQTPVNKQHTARVGFLLASQKGPIQTWTTLHNFGASVFQKGRSPYAEGKPSLLGLGARPAHD